jgi:hypothetical protein
MIVKGNGNPVIGKNYLQNIKHMLKVQQQQKTTMNFSQSIPSNASNVLSLNSGMMNGGGLEQSTNHQVTEGEQTEISDYQGQ